MVNRSFSTIQYNTTVKLAFVHYHKITRFSTIQYNTTVKRVIYENVAFVGFSTIQYNTTVKLHRDDVAFF